MHNLLKPAYGSTQKRKRVARGNSGGGGTTAGRGTKGQQSRTGKGRAFGFEGGQVPLLMRQPKLGGFRSPRKVNYEIINLATIEEKLGAGSYDGASLKKLGIVSSNRPVKILGMGTVSKKFDLTLAGASKTAKDAIAKAGGSITIKK